jgi:hypothetical protein
MGFFDNINDTIQLAKNTFVVLGKNTDALKPTFTQIKLGLSFYILFLVSIAMLYYTTGITQTIAVYAIILFFFLAIPLFPFIKMYYKASQSWIVYNTFTGKNVSYKDGLARAGKNKGDIITLGIFDILFSALSQRLKSGTGRGGAFVIVNVILWIFGKTVEEGWDLIGHYLLPASIIQEKNVGEVLPEINSIKNNVPGVLAGVFGFDFAGDIVKGLLQ